MEPIAASARYARTGRRGHVLRKVRLFMFLAALLAIALSTTPSSVAEAPVVAPLLATPKPDGAPLVVQQLRTCQDARLALGIPLESPAGTLSDIVRIDVMSSLRISRTIGLVYSLRNGREFFALASGVLTDRARLEATNEFMREATFGGHPDGIDRSNEGYSVEPVLVDGRRLTALGVNRLNCAAVRVL